MSLAFTFVDLLVVVIVGVSTVFAVWRGFISETLSIVAWAAAAFASLYFGPWVAPLMAHMISPWWLAYIAGYAAVFLVILIPISFASFRVSESVRRSSVGPLDRSLGAAFGIARGLVIIGGLYLLFSLVVPLRDHPSSLRDARLLPLIQSSAEVLIALAPHEDRMVAQERMRTEPAASAPLPWPPDHEGLPTPRPKPDAGTAHKRQSNAYGAKDRRALDRLIESSGDSGSGKP
jgi:membrane protein required for colicin V production